MFVAFLVAILIGLWFLAPKRERAADARIAQLEGRLAVLQRELTDAQSATATAVDKVAKRKHAVQVGDTVIRLGLASARRVIADSTASPDTLRLVLSRTIEKVERYQGEVLRYQEAVDSLLITQSQERQAWSAQIDTLNALVQASVPASCAVFGVRCPNRTTAFLLGVGSALLLAVAVAF